MDLFINEVFGAFAQLLLFSIIPIMVWKLSNTNENFFEWIGLKIIKHEGNVTKTIIYTLLAVGIYGLSIQLVMKMISNDITLAGSSFTNMGIRALPAAIVYGYIRTGLCEEIFFRGFLLKTISKKSSFVVGNTFQALIFGMMHGLPFGLATHNLLITILLTLSPALLGWFQGWLNEKRSGGSIIPSWLLHGTINTIVAILSL